MNTIWSFWEKESFQYYDYIVVGGGIVGLSTAASLLEKSPDARIVVLERGMLPSGASTKNAGFACFGSLTELLNDLQHASSDEVVALVERRWTGLLKLRNRLGEKAMGFENFGGHELLFEHNQHEVDRLDDINHMLKPIFKKEVYSKKPSLIAQFGFNQQMVKNLIVNPLESQIHSGTMMRSLARFVTERGVQIWTGMNVKTIEDTGNDVSVSVYDPNLNYHASLRAKHVAVCTNAFGRQFFPQLDITPGRGQVIVTSPIPNLPFKGTFHFDGGYYYFRNVDNRVLFGGGRNLDFKGEATTEFGTTTLIINQLEKYLHTMILPRHDWKIEHKWAGIMAFGTEKKPIVQSHGPRVHVGLRMGGMGVAIGSHIGEQLADMMHE